MKPKVSVIIPVYNVEKYIERCAQSLFEQTLTGIEYLFIDDCSTDSSLEILEYQMSRYNLDSVSNNSYVRIVKMPNNMGQAHVRRYGMQCATGDYIIQCDSDDWMEETMLYEMWNKASQEDLDVVICDFYHDKGNERIYHMGIRSCNSEDVFYDILSSKSSWTLCNKMFHRRLFVENDIIYPKDGMNMGEDMLLTAQLLYYCKRSGRIGYVNKALYHYCDNHSSITNQQSAKQILWNTLCWRSNIYSLERFLKKNGVDRRAKDCILFVKYGAKRRLQPFIADWKYAMIWRSLFREINYRLLLSPMISRRTKWTYCKIYIKALCKILGKQNL